MKLAEQKTAAMVAELPDVSDDQVSWRALKKKHVQKNRRTSGTPEAAKAPKAPKVSLPGWARGGPGSELQPDDPPENDAESRFTRSSVMRIPPRLNTVRHRATTAHACSLYPLGVHGGFGHRGVFLGLDALGGGGSFIYDPFFALEEMTRVGVTNTNMMVLGQPGYGKSALIKTLLYRSAAVFGSERFTTICDVKGEYEELANLVGLECIKLAPGGTTRVNPLEVIGEVGDDQDIARSRFAACKALIEMSLPGHRPMSVLEGAFLHSVIVCLGERRNVQPILSDVVRLLASPPEEIVNRLEMTRDEARHEIRELRLVVESLVSGPLGGMFDGQSNVRLDPFGPGVVIDISSVASDPNALPLVWVAATTWLRMLMLRKSGRKKIQVFDESWKMLAHGPLAAFLQDCWKLMRSYGGANIAVLHKPGDLAAQSDDGSAASKISQGLLADTAVRVTFRQTRRDLDAYAELLGYGPAEITRIASLGRGESFWKLGDVAAHLQHRIHGDVEHRLCDTNQAMRNNTGNETRSGDIRIQEASP